MSRDRSRGYLGYYRSANVWTRALSMLQVLWLTTNTKNE